MSLEYDNYKDVYNQSQGEQFWLKWQVEKLYCNALRDELGEKRWRQRYRSNFKKFDQEKDESNEAEEQENGLENIF